MAGDRELLYDHFGTSDINKRAGGKARKDNLVDETCVGDYHSKNYTDWSSGGEDEYELFDQTEIVWEVLDERNAERNSCCPLVDHDGKDHIDNADKVHL